MYERFTDAARKVMQLANQEAQRFNHEYVGTEHILLGLIKLKDGVSFEVLKSLDVDLRKVRLEVEKIVQSGPERVTMGELPITPRAKKVLEYAMEESKGKELGFIGTQQLLLGLLREQEGIAAQVLMNLGLKLEDVREKIRDILFKKSVENDGKVEVLKKYDALIGMTHSHINLAIECLVKVIIFETNEYEKISHNNKKHLNEAFDKLRVVRDVMEQVQ